MKKIILATLFLLGLASLPAEAQTPPCSGGAIPGMIVGQAVDNLCYYLKVNSDGSITVSGGGGGGGGAVFGPTAQGSAAANPPVTVGGTINGGATGLVQNFAMKAASTAPAATDPAAVVVLSPNGNQSNAANQTSQITLETALNALITTLNSSVASPIPQACSSNIPVSQITSTDLKTGTGKIYICSIKITSGDAENLSLVEGTGTVCATSTVALDGATTAANGNQIAANGGWAEVSPAYMFSTSVTGNHLCLLQSGTGRVAGHITYSDH